MLKQKQTEVKQHNQSNTSSVEWWRGAVIYQIYPRSLKDTNGDGVGDLPGIIEKLDYIASLGVDAIWISPIFKSPMKDFGYDISDYRDIDPLFGTLNDFDRLIHRAHGLGLKVIVDQVLSHTSDQHDWFQQSRSSRNSSKSDWYVWADAKADGTPPNNWLSIFGGSAWQWEPRRKQYYLHNFLVNQPDLNFHSDEVRQASLDNLEFWLKRGVDGFRLDAINFCYHDAQLRDNPAKPEDRREGRGFSEDNPYAYQYHFYNNTQSENLTFIKDIRVLLDEYPGSVSLGEISSEDSLVTMAEYTQGNDRLHMSYSFELLTEEFSATYIRKTVEKLEVEMSDSWPCWTIGNHDVKRVVSRWNGDQLSDEKSKLFSTLLCCLRGTVCSYQGEELGLTEAELQYDELQDPYGIAFWPNFKGRDGCRTPIPWDSKENGSGFSETKPWLPIPNTHKLNAVNIQLSKENSVLRSFKQLLVWRKSLPLLITGGISFLQLEEPLLGFFRKDENQELLLIFNLSSQEHFLSDSDLNIVSQLKQIKGPAIAPAKRTEEGYNFPSYSLLIADVF
ncbi:MAG: alpha-amylase family glycosyl hydrolase [Enterobacterales bacterium]|nr:alpha-amylase family glycosyl hydrolase [Enterobacterales bacterium]